MSDGEEIFMVYICFPVYLKTAEKTSIIRLLALPEEESISLLMSIQPGLK